MLRAFVAHTCALLRAIPGRVYGAAAAAALLLCAVAIAHAWATTTDSFAVDEIVVIGNQHLGADEVERIAGLTRGQNVLELDTRSAARKLLTNPWVADARIERRLPNRLVISLQEKRAVALVLLDHLYLVDSLGAAFKRATPAEVRGLPVITGLNRRGYVEQRQESQQLIAEAVEILERYHANHTRPQIGEIERHQSRGYHLYTYNRGTAIVLGHRTPSTMTPVLEAFDYAWNALSPHERQRARTIFLDRGDTPDRVTVSFAEES